MLASPNTREDAHVVLPTIISGLQLYFEKAIGCNLLYRFERPQYAQMRKKYVTGQTVIIGNEKDMTEVYGAEHLLRLIGTLYRLYVTSTDSDVGLVSLPPMVAKSTMDPESVIILKEYVHELMECVP